MVRVQTRGEQIRSYIVEHVAEHPHDIAKQTAKRFQITRQAVNRYLQNLVAEGILDAHGATANRLYKLRTFEEWNKTYALTPGLAEDVIWRDDVAPALGKLPSNALDIWRYAFTEMFNNAIDHSEGTKIFVSIAKTAASIEMSIMDNGVGIFKKIQKAANLLDERHAVLELSKGKLTTDPANHTGEGIFFTSRVVDRYQILSGRTFFSHEVDDGDEYWITQPPSETPFGTGVWMIVNNHTSRTTKKIFDKYTSGDDIGFTKTIVPVRLAQYGKDELVSRSQAKRLLARVDRFKTVIFNFSGVDTIGPAFADEIFRVFRVQHPEIELHATSTNAAVRAMIDRATFAERANATASFDAQVIPPDRPAPED